MARALHTIVGLVLLALAGCSSVPVLPGSPPAAKDLPVTVRFDGERTRERDELVGVIGRSLEGNHGEGEQVSRADVDDAAYDLMQHYLELGYPEADVGYRFPVEDDGKQPAKRPIALFEITEGPYFEVESVSLSGELGNFEREELLLLVVPESPEFVERRIDAGASALADLYYSSGYLAADVGEPTVEFDRERGIATVRIDVRAGPRFAVRSVEIEAEAELAEAVPERLRKIPKGASTPSVAFGMRGRLLEYFSHQGFPDCRVQVRDERDLETGDVDLSFTIELGERVTVRAVELEGNRDVDDHFILSHLALSAGERYDSRALDQSFRELYSTGLFERIDITLAEDAGEQRTLVVSVAELPSREFYVEPGWGSYEGPRLRLGGTDKNLFGRGKKLRADMVVSPKAQNVSLTGVDPWFRESEYSASLTLFTGRREEPSFTVEEYGTGLSFDRQWTPKIWTSFGHNFRAERLSDVEANVLALDGAEEDVDISSLGFAFVRDSRDSPFLPRRGTRFSLGLEWATTVLGSEVDFLEVTLDRSHLIALSRRTVWAISTRTGVIVPIATTDTIPLSERFFNGGENTVRSFREDELGPLDSDGDPLGGEAYTVLSTELRRDIAGRLGGALFVDFGNVAADHNDYFEFDEFRTAVGVGLRYRLPIGPLRIDAGWNPTADDDEDEVVVHFAVGMAY